MKNNLIVGKNTLNKAHRGIYLIGLMFCITLLMVNFASAFELNPFAEKKIYETSLKEDMSDFIKQDFNSKYGVIQLSKTMLWFETDRIAEYSLIENTDQCLINCESKGKAVLYSPGKLFDDKDFLDKKGININVNSQYYIKVIEEYEIEVPDKYESVCTPNIDNKTGIEKGGGTCVQEPISYKKEIRTREVWNEYNFETLKKGEYEWKVIGSKDPNKDVDFIPTARGKEFKEWVWWNGDWSNKKEVTIYTADSTSRGNVSVLLNVSYDSNMQADFDDLRFINTEENAELGYWFYNNTKIDSNSVQVWVKLDRNISSSSNVTIYMYYGNSGASSTSEVANAGLLGDDFNDASVDFTNRWVSDDQSKYVTSSGKLVASSTGVANMLSSKNSLGTQYMWEWRAYTDNSNTDGGYFLVSSPAKNYASSDHVDIWSNQWRFLGFASSTSGTASPNVYYRLKGKLNGNSLMMNVTTDAQSQLVTASGTSSSTADYLELVQYNGGGNTAKIYVDWVFVRKYVANEPAGIFGAEQDSEGVAISLSSPANAFTSSSQTIFFNATITPTSATIKNVTLYLNGEEYLDLYDTNETINYSKILSLDDGNYTWNITACWIGVSEDESCTQSDTRTFEIDSTAPSVNILYPTGTINYGYLGQNISLNYSISDASLDSCWYEYNGTNKTLNCSTNTTFILTSQKNLTLYANDTVGNTNYSVASWDYRVFENSQTYNNETISGNYETFRLNTTILSGLNINSANLIYNGTSYSALIYSSGQERNFEVSLETPILMTDQNLSFYWNLVGSSFSVNTSERTQLVRPVLLDNCSTFTFKILNISLYDEKLKTPLTGNIEFNYQLLNSYSFSELDTINLSATSVQSLGICSNINISNLDIFYSAEIKYSADGYAPELYHVQRAEITEDTPIIRLYDLNQTDSTEFKITYQDDSYIYVEGAIVQLMRKYISEDIYEVVEAPLTSNEGAAVVHIDLSTNKYQATIIKDGIVLDFFDNLVFKCDSILTGDCTQKLFGSINPSNEVNVDNLLDFAYSEPVISGNTITVFFSIPSNTPSEVNLIMKQKDPFSNATICNQTITSSAGSIQCAIEETLGDSYLDLQIIKDDSLIASSSYIIPADDDLDFLGNNFFILFIIVLSLVMMALSSPEWIIVEGVITIIIGGALFLINGVSFVIGLGSVMWLIIAAGILIFKLARQEDR